MAVLHITESELARDVHRVIGKVRGGADPTVDEDFARDVQAVDTHPEPLDTSA
jgi:hypothetical protein